MSHAYHSDTSFFPPHTFRPGDIAELQDESVALQAGAGAGGGTNVTGGASAATSGASKGRRKDTKKKQKNRDVSPARAPSSEAPAEEADNKPAQSSSSPGQNTKPLSGVVYRVSDNKIILTLNSKASASIPASNPDSNSSAGKASGGKGKKAASASSSATLGSLYRLVKVANDVTFDRMEKTLVTLARERLGLSDFAVPGQADAAKKEKGKQHGEDSQVAQTHEAQDDAARDPERAQSTAESSSATEPADTDTADDGEGAKQDENAEGDEEEDEEADASSSSSDEAEGEGSKDNAQNGTSASVDRSSTLIRALLGMEPFDRRGSMKIEKQDLPPLPISPPLQSRLNDSQIQAIRRCLLPATPATETTESGKSQPSPRALPFHLIHGPPGTGKTTTIVELILQIALGLQLSDVKPNKSLPGEPAGKLADAVPMRPARVLVCGASNLAVDTIAERLLSPSSPWKSRLASAGAKITRIGHPARVLPSVSQCTLDQQRENSDAGALLDDVHAELKSAMEQLYPTADSLSVRAKPHQKRLKGSARKEAWERRGLR
jgi:AAA domain